MSEPANEPSVPADASGLPPFDPNGYRKRVLAAVEQRGGPDTSDPFELYDLPLADLDDAAVAARVAEVWAFWQRQRDHPRYRALVAQLVATHTARSAEVLDAVRRSAALARVRAKRAEREAERYALLDAAVERLVQRHGRIPPDKVAGLEEIGALSGLTRAEVAGRLRRAPAPAGVSADRRRQIRALLDEFGRLTDADAPPTLLVLMGLTPAATPQQIRVSAGAWRSRARELAPGRLRAVVDELLVHVAELLEPGRAAVEAYLDAVAEDVTAWLRPRVRAAVLVEDELVAADHAHLLDEARARGLDERRATAALAALAAEAGADVEPPFESGRRYREPTPGGRSGRDDPGAGGSAQPRDPGTGGPGPDRAGREGEAGRAGSDRERGDRGDAGPAGGRRSDPLAPVRAALRAGRPREARRTLDEAARDDPPARALAGEIDAVLADAARRDAAARAAAGGRRWVEALRHLEHLTRTAADAVDDLAARTAAARDAVAAADRAVATAEAGPGADRAAALAAVLDACRDHPGAAAALDRLPPAAPAWVSAARDGRGDVVVLWAASPAHGVTYRVRRQRPDGTWQVIGRVPVNAIEDGGAPPGVEPPIYAVAVLAGGRSSEETRSDAVPAPSVPFRPAGAAAPAWVRATRRDDGTVEICWDPVPGNDVEYRVRCLDGDQWRVVGRIRGTRLDDGGAPNGPLPVYGVSAATGSVRSPEVRSTGG